MKLKSKEVAQIKSNLNKVICQLDHFLEDGTSNKFNSRWGLESSIEHCNEVIKILDRKNESDNSENPDTSY